MMRFSTDVRETRGRITLTGIVVAVLVAVVLVRVMHFPLQLASVVFFVLALLPACILVFPRMLVASSHDHDELKAAERLGAENDIRTTLLQGLAGAFFLVTAFLSWSQLQVARDGEVTDRFTAAIEQLGDKNRDIRIGGIYALGRIADDSPSNRPMITEVLSAFVREHSKWQDKERTDTILSLRNRAADIQVALAVLGRRAVPKKLHLSDLELVETDLRRADLLGGHFEKFDFFRTHFEGADLFGAYLDNANLREAHFEGPRRFGDPYTFGAARLQRASLRRADLRKANLANVDLTAANLAGADLSGANLKGSDLSEAILEGARLDGVTADLSTKWPAAFQPSRAGVVVK